MPYVAPTEDEIRQVAYRAFELRGRSNGFDQADWYMAKRAIRFSTVITKGSSFTESRKRPPITSGDPASQVCRFCTAAGQTFNTEPHAVPTLLGNRRLLSHYGATPATSCSGNSITTSARSPT